MAVEARARRSATQINTTTVVQTCATPSGRRGNLALGLMITRGVRLGCAATNIVAMLPRLRVDARSAVIAGQVRVRRSPRLEVHAQRITTATATRHALAGVAAHFHSPNTTTRRLIGAIVPTVTGTPTEIVKRQKGRGVLLKLLVKQSKKVGRHPVDEESLLIAGLDTERIWSTPVHHPKKLRLRLVSAEARRFTRVLAFYHPIFWRVVKQGRDGVVDDSHDTLELFLAARDVFVKVRTLEVVSLEELREDARVRVDHVDVGVAVVRESFSDVTL